MQNVLVSNVSMIIAIAIMLQYIQIFHDNYVLREYLYCYHVTWHKILYYKSQAILLEYIHLPISDCSIRVYRSFVNF